MLKAQSNASASGLLKKIKIYPRKHSILHWSWKIGSTVPEGDALTKEGDDYTARAYIIFGGLLGFGTTSLNYIWANRLPKGQLAPNPFSSSVIMVAIQSGNGLAGRWLHEERNIRQDYLKAFNKEPPQMGLVAIMSDSDNTGSRTTAFWGDIHFRAKR